MREIETQLHNLKEVEILEAAEGADAVAVAKQDVAVSLEFEEWAGQIQKAAGRDIQPEGVAPKIGGVAETLSGQDSATIAAAAEFVAAV